MQTVVSTQMEVRWGECDAAGIVYHPVYIDWFSVARMNYLKENGVPYMKQFHDSGIVLVVLEANCKYVKTLRAEDVVRVDARLSALSRTRMRLEYAVFDAQNNLCAQGTTDHAYVDMETQKAVNVAKRTPALWNNLQRLSIEA
jgi:acyl-CoA thioester hydrolase